MHQEPEIQLIVGLGNPGEEYRGSRHNIGFAVVDELARHHATGQWRTLETHREVSARIGGRSVVLACPLTYMNRSGHAVGALHEREGLAPQGTLVVVDDIDLGLGRMRIRRRGGPGTHNGLRSIGEVVGDDYPRLRVGVGGAEPGTDLAAYVLAPFPESEQPMVGKVVEQARAAIEAAVTDGVGASMNRFNGIVIDDTHCEKPESGKIWELAPLKACPSAEWCVVDEVVILECPQPEGKGPRYWGDWFRWWTGPHRIRLDPVGSAAWLRMDGSTTLGAIVDAMAAEMSDDREHLVARLDLFVRTLASRGLVRLET